MECAGWYYHGVSRVQRGALIIDCNLTAAGQQVEDFLDIVGVRADLIAGLELVDEHGELG